MGNVVLMWVNPSSLSAQKDRVEHRALRWGDECLNGGGGPEIL